MSKWKITTITKYGNFVAWANTKEKAQEFAKFQKKKGGWDCKIEEVTEE